MKIQTNMYANTNIPFEIQEDIIRRVLPVKSLLRFRTISKQWKSLIDSPEFITEHCTNPTLPHHLLLRYDAPFVEGKYKYISIVDDDSFPRQKFALSLPSTVKLVTHALMLGCSQGLVCLVALRQEPLNGKNLIVLWNPSIKKSIGLVFTGVFSAVGFGVCPKTSDPKIIKITGKNSMDCSAEVFTLSSRTWKSVAMNLPYKFINFDLILNQVVIDGVIYWIASYLITNNDRRISYQIISFDLTSEEFGEANLPDCLSYARNLSICKLKGSLAILNNVRAHDHVDVWMMNKNGDSNYSFTKLFVVSFDVEELRPCYFHKVAGFRKNGQPITQHFWDSKVYCVKTLEVCEPCTEHSNYPRVNEAKNSRFVIDRYSSRLKMTSYTESLILLSHQSDTIIQL